MPDRMDIPIGPVKSPPSKTKLPGESTSPKKSPRKSPKKKVAIDQHLVGLLSPEDLKQSPGLEILYSRVKSVASQQLDLGKQSSAVPGDSPGTGNGSAAAREVLYSREKSESSDAKPSVGPSRGKLPFCDTCRVHCSSEISMSQHLKGRKHRIMSLHKDCEKLRDNRNGIFVLCSAASPPDAHKISVEFGELDTKRVVEFRVRNSSGSSADFDGCELVDLKRISRFSRNDFELQRKFQRRVEIQNNNELTVPLRCLRRNVGFYLTKIAFTFNKPKMIIVRDVEIQVITDVMKNLGPKAPYKRPPRVSVKSAAVKTVEGIRPEGDHSKDELERTVRLDNYYIPSVVRSSLNHGLKETEDGKQSGAISEIKSLLASDLCKENYARRFSLLLHIEEAQMEVDIRKYDMTEAKLDKCKENSKLLTLDVPGLSENRPSVLVGDHLFLRRLKNDKTPEDVEYKAYVHRVCLNRVELGVNAQLRDNWIANMKLNCRFSFNRLPLRLQHRAVQFAEENSLFDFLFPNVDSVCQRGLIQPVETPMIFYNDRIGNNEQQALAVRHIVAGSSRPAPFLIFGPPGTGKTVTMVEAMKQVVKCIPASRILACAPSNNAADLLTERLLEHVSKNSVFRMNAASRDWSQVPTKVKECANYDKAKGYFFPPWSELSKRKVIVTTLVTAGRLVSANVPAGHFTHIFIDEAGQSLEPEAVIPIAGIFESSAAKRDGGQVVLAGDPEQLGPVLRSPIAIQCGLSISLLERLMRTVHAYQRRSHPSSVSEAYDPRLLVKLVRNYRSHPDILQIPNESFYLNELEACADKTVRESLCKWEELPKKDVPLIFHGVVGKDEREERSPSFFNVAEISVVIDYVNKLLEMKQNRIAAKDIGIISPYRKQVQKFRQALKLDKYKELTVGTVEEFQGQERKVIFISTVRSSVEFLQLDYGSKLGFLKNPKRFNVAVTRAKALLIVVGNPHVLCSDVHWNKLLKFCMDQGVYTGCEFDYSDESDSDEDLDECVATLERLKLSDMNAADVVNSTELDISATTHVTEPEWRDNI